MKEISLATTWQTDWRPEFVGTLMFIVVDRQVLLIRKKTGHGAGRINGPGGKIQPGESVLACAVRETREEVGLTPIAPVCLIELRFVEEDGPQWLGFACVARDFRGDPVETEEAAPFWCSLADIPYARMWPDDEIWLPRVLQDQQQIAQETTQVPLVADFLFRAGRLVDHRWRDGGSIVGHFP